MAVAERVAHERGERVGESVGYSIRLESIAARDPERTLTFCTTGVMLRRLMSAMDRRGASSTASSSDADRGAEATAMRALQMTHLLLDEVHARDLHSDFVLTVVRELLSHCRELKLIPVSYTHLTLPTTPYV